MRDYEFGNFLHELRERRGLSQYQLGMLVGVSDKAVSKWENGLSKPQSRILYGLSEVLNVSVDELLACRYRFAEIKRRGLFAQKKELWKKAYDRMKFLYGDTPPVEVSDRYYREYTELGNTDSIVYFEFLSRMKKTAADRGEQLRITGSIGTSFAAYLMGASEINPLRPHFYCPICRKIQFRTEVSCGWDLPSETCVCGTELLRDGQNLPFEVLRSGLGKMARYDILLSQRLYQEAQETLLSCFEENEVIPLTKKEEDGFRAFVISGDQSASSLSFKEFSGPLRPYPVITLTIDKDLDRFRHLEEETGISFDKVPFADRKILNAFRTELIQENHPVYGAAGIPEFRTAYVKKMIQETAPDSFYDFIQIPGLAHGTGTWEGNGKELLSQGLPAGRLIAYRDDIFHYIREKMVKRGLDGTGYACQLMEEAARGVFARKGMGADIRQQLSDLGAESWFTESLGKIRYLFPRAQGILQVRYALILMWYKVCCPQAWKRI